MFLVIPVFWPFLVIYLIFRFWRVTVPLLAVAGLYGLFHWAPLLGWSLIGFIALIAVPVLWSQHRDREIGRLRAGRAPLS